MLGVTKIYEELRRHDATPTNERKPIVLLPREAFHFVHGDDC
jgi:hypothetical protein